MLAIKLAENTTNTDMSELKQYQAVIELLESNNIDNIWLAYYTSLTIQGFWQTFERQLLQVASQRENYQRLDTVISVSLIRDVHLEPSIVNAFKPIEIAIKEKYDVNCRVDNDLYKNTIVLNFTGVKGKLFARAEADIDSFELNPTWMGFCEGDDFDTFSKVIECIKDLKQKPEFFETHTSSNEEVQTANNLIKFLEKVMSIDHSRVEEEWRQHRWSKLLRQGKFSLGNPNAVYACPINSIEVFSVEGKKAECEYTICTSYGRGRKRVYTGTKKVSSKAINVWTLYEKVKHLL